MCLEGAHRPDYFGRTGDSTLPLYDDAAGPFPGADRRTCISVQPRVWDGPVPYREQHEPISTVAHKKTARKAVFVGNIRRVREHSQAQAQGRL